MLTMQTITTLVQKKIRPGLRYFNPHNHPFNACQGKERSMASQFLGDRVIHLGVAKANKTLLLFKL